MSCPIKVNINKIELTIHTSFYCNLDLLCVIWYSLVSAKCRNRYTIPWFYNWLFRYTFGPLPKIVCLVELVFKNAIVTQMMLFLDGMILIRYIFIFWLQNPAGFNDEFWEKFVSFWIVGFAMISQFVFVFMPGKYTVIKLYTLPMMFYKSPPCQFHNMVLNLVI